MSDETDVTSTDDGAEAADQMAEIEAAMAEARARLADVAAEVVVTNHVMGLYELAAIHLSSPTPDLVSAALAIDSMALLVDGLGDRLGEECRHDERCARQHPHGVRQREIPNVGRVVHLRSPARPSRLRRSRRLTRPTLSRR